MKQSNYLNIVNAACTLARDEGFASITRDAVAARAEVSTSLIFHYFDTIDALRNAVINLAIDCGDAQLLSSGLAVKYPAALAAPPELRREAVKILSEELTQE